MLHLMFNNTSVRLDVFLLLVYSNKILAFISSFCCKLKGAFISPWYRYRFCNGRRRHCIPTYRFHNIPTSVTDNVGIVYTYTFQHQEQNQAVIVLPHDSCVPPSMSSEYKNGSKMFFHSIHLLRTTTGLQSTEIVDVEEMVVMFLHVLAHSVKNCMVEREFLQSGRTISWQFNIVLLTELQLHEELLKKPQLGTNGCTDPRWKRSVARFL